MTTRSWSAVYFRRKQHVNYRVLPDRHIVAQKTGWRAVTLWRARAPEQPVEVQKSNRSLFCVGHTKASDLESKKRKNHHQHRIEEY